MVTFMDVLAEKFQNMQEVSYMAELTLSNGLTWNMVEIVLEYFANNTDDALYFLSVGLGTFTEPEELDHGLREDDFTYFEVNLIVFEDIDLIDASLDSDVLEDGDDKLDNFVFFLLSHMRTN